MVQTTPAPADAIDLPVGTIVGIAIGVILFLALAGVLYYFFQYCCSIYVFVKDNNNMDFLYSMEAVNRDCGSLVCINASKEAISCCCPSLRENLKNAKLYASSGTQITLTKTESPFKLFAYKKNPAYTLLQKEPQTNFMLP